MVPSSSGAQALPSGVGMNDIAWVSTGSEGLDVDPSKVELPEPVTVGSPLVVTVAGPVVDVLVDVVPGGAVEADEVTVCAPPPVEDPRESASAPSPVGSSTGPQPRQSTIASKDLLDALIDSRRYADAR